MSGIYIPGMEMPTNCCQCPVNTEICKRGYKYLLAHPELYDKRADDCPLVPVPDCVRLGDLEALVEKLKRHREFHLDDSHSGICIAEGISQCIDILTGREAPTIIPADPAGKEEEL